MRDINMLKHTIKVNKVIVTILWISLIGSIYGIMRQPTTLGTVRLGVSLMGVFASSIFVYKKVFHNATGLILIISYVIPTLSTVSNQYIAGMLAMIGLYVSSLYLNKVYLLICGAFYNVILVFIQLSSKSFESWIFFATLICIDFVAIILFFLCKWGYDLVKSAAQKEIAAKEQLTALDNAVKVGQALTSQVNEGFEKIKLSFKN